MNEHTIAAITASAIGTNRKRATPWQEEHRHEHDADAEQRDEGRRHDLRRAIHDRGLDFLALLEMPVDVLDRHGRVVDQDADRERKAAERHDVERFAERREDRDRAKNRKRDRDRDDDGRAPASEEHQDHQAGQRRRDDAFMNDAADRGADEQRLIADQRDIELASADVGLSCSTLSLMPAMIASVETEPFFSTCISTERLPSTCTMLVCGGLPSRTCATSRM